MSPELNSVSSATSEEFTLTFFSRIPMTNTFRSGGRPGSSPQAVGNLDHLSFCQISINLAIFGGETTGGDVQHSTNRK